MTCRCKSSGTFSLVNINPDKIALNTRFYDRKLFLDLKSKKIWYKNLGFLFMWVVSGVLLLFLGKALISMKDVLRRKLTIYEYLKFLVLWKMKIENQDNDLVIMKEEMDMLNELRDLYNKRALEKKAALRML